MMAPSPLMDDLVEEILLRVPPSDPATLIRAGLICKSWRRILSDPDFFRRYHDDLHHRTPPLLGFLHSSGTTNSSPRVHGFVSLVSPSPFSQPSFVSASGDPSSWRVLDCRHGRVLVFIRTNSRPDDDELVVWDPITGDERHLAPPSHPYDCAVGAVLCAAADRCDHRSCHRGPSLVVFVGSSECTTWACVRSSNDDDAAAGTTWSRASAIFHGDINDWASLLAGTERSLLAGDDLYFTAIGGSSQMVLKYSLSDRWLGLHLNFLPFWCMENKQVLMTAEDGKLGVAGVSVTGHTLELWSRQTAAGINTWTRDRAIELKSMLPIAFGDPPAWTNPEFRVLAFAEGADTVFISTNAGVFALGLKSGRVKKVLETTVSVVVFPYVGFINCRPCS
ncbi:unnamed protein product [Urochloa humidicola]